MADTGATYPGTAATEAVDPEDDQNWSNPDRIKADDGSKAVCGTTSASTQYSYRLKATNFGFSLPAGATITGILVEIERCESNAAANAVDYRVQLLDATGALIGDNKANGNEWVVQPTMEIINYGGDTDAWNASPTKEMVEDADFGVVLSFSLISNGSSLYAGWIDFIRMTVYYSVAVDITVDVPCATISSQAHAPTMSLGTTISPPVATISGQSYAPTMSLDKVISIPCALISGQAFAPEITEGQGVIISVPLALITSQAYAPTLSLGITISPPVATISGQAYAPTLSLGITILPPIAIISSQAYAPSLSLDKVIAIPCALITGQAYPAIVEIGVIIVVPVALITGQAYAPRVLFGRSLDAIRNLPAVRTLASIREQDAL